MPECTLKAKQVEKRRAELMAMVMHMLAAHSRWCATSDVLAALREAVWAQRRAVP